MPEKLQALRSAYRQFGIADGTLYLFARLMEKLSRGHARLIRYRFVAQPVPDGEIASLRPSASTTIRFVTPGDPIVSHFPRPPRVIARRFASGARCMVIESGGTFAGFLWLAYDQYEEDEVRCLYRLDTPTARAWDFDVYIVPAYRVGRSFARLWSAANAHLSAQGVQWSLSRISAFNPGSLAAHRALGVREISSATFVRLGTLQLSFYGSAPFVHVGWSDDARPVITLTPPETF